MKAKTMAKLPRVSRRGEGELAWAAMLQPDTYTHIKHRRQSQAVAVIKVYLRWEAADSLHRFSVAFHFEAAVDSYSIR